MQHFREKNKQNKFKFLPKVLRVLYRSRNRTLPTFEELLLGDLYHHVPIRDPLLVAHHHLEIPVGDFLDNLVVGQVQIFHERCNLSQQGVVSYNFGFAISLSTFLAKADSIVKFCALTILIAFITPVTTSSTVPRFNSLNSLSDPSMNHDRACATLSISFIPDRTSATESLPVASSADRCIIAPAILSIVGGWIT